MITPHWANLLPFLAGAGLLLAAWPRFRHSLRIRRWRKSLGLPTHQPVFNEIYANVDGFALSKQDRYRNDLPQLVYGEIEFESFIALLSLCAPDANTRFYDLGCGTGKAVLAISMVFSPAAATGIECLPGLYACAVAQQKKLASMPAYQKVARRIEFHHADFFACEMENATLVFINATAFFGENWQNLIQYLLKLPTGCWCITTTRPLPEEYFKLIRKTPVRMSWGIVSAFIHQKMAQVEPGTFPSF